MRLSVAAAGLVLALGAPPQAAAQIHQEVRNGATCQPYPLTGSPPAGVAINHFLYGFRGQAFCQLEIPDDYDVEDLSWVQAVLAPPSSGTVYGRLCVYGVGDLVGTCGQRASVASSSIGVAFLFPPPDVSPQGDIGAYVRFDFPRESVSVVQYLLPRYNR